MRNLIEEIIRTLESGEEIILVGITHSSGSAPRTSGARMLVKKDGSIGGTVGGGALEGKCIKETKVLFDTSLDHKTIDFSLDAESVASEGMVCGGSVSVLLHKINKEQLNLFQHLLISYKNSARPLLLTILPKEEKNGPKLIVADRENMKAFGPDFYEFLRKKAGRAPFLVRAGETEIFVEPIVSPGVVHLIGAGHVALATAQLAAFADFEVVVVDDRGEFANHDRYPEAREIRVLDSFDSCFDRLTADDYVVIVTRGHLHDREVLAQALGTDAGYIGMIGSRKKRNVVYDSLREEGFTDIELDRVYSPIGLSIGADTPNEIGLSIVGELVKVRAEAGKKHNTC